MRTTADYGTNADFRAGVARLGLADSAREDVWGTITWGTRTACPITAVGIDADGVRRNGRGAREGEHRLKRSVPPSGQPIRLEPRSAHAQRRRICCRLLVELAQRLAGDQHQSSTAAFFAADSTRTQSPAKVSGA
jgi:hypothetical protein